MYNYDVIVVGAGHAGCEAAHASSKMGAKTLLITNNIETIAWMSCNPAMGGQAKAQIICEVDALGGVIGEITDKSGIQFRIINTRKGPAMRTLRAQCDRIMYHKEMLVKLQNTENLSLLQDTVLRLILQNNIVLGVECEISGEIKSKTVVLTCGTFLNGVIHIGEKTLSGGRAAEKAVQGLSDFLKENSINIIRLKTGTPPRVSGKSIDFSQMIPQYGDENPIPFSRRTEKITNPQICCYITHTNENTHNIIRKNINKSALYSGRIKSIGPRYCPSIEDKVVKFPDRNSHHVFLEPEGLDNNEYYVNGLSTSLPCSVQLMYLRTIKGMENVDITRFAYAIEYDAFDPKLLYPTLESKIINNLFLAGQINGTSGYEEAAGMGIIAGINAVLKISNDSFILSRMESYIGVMIDDLITKGISEPYRMFTSRAENRIYLRIDNTDDRLLEKGYKLKLINKTEFDRYREEKKLFDNIIDYLKKKGFGLLIKQNKITMDNIRDCLPDRLRIKKMYEKAWVYIYYEGYIKKQESDIMKLSDYSKLKLDKISDYMLIKGLRKESAVKLNKYRPETIEKARYVEGVNPADIIILINKLKS
ncbi:MAG: tRNA uridine-5-carboxymethylaminomethyl(34) synthesis enzyme MnmG [Candidatus Hydrogenedentota bacterium]